MESKPGNRRRSCSRSLRLPGIVLISALHCWDNMMRRVYAETLRVVKRSFWKLLQHANCFEKSAVGHRRNQWPELWASLTQRFRHGIEAVTGPTRRCSINWREFVPDLAEFFRRESGLPSNESFK